MNTVDIEQLAPILTKNAQWWSIAAGFVGATAALLAIIAAIKAIHAANVSQEVSEQKEQKIRRIVQESAERTAQLENETALLKKETAEARLELAKIDPLKNAVSRASAVAILEVTDGKRVPEGDRRDTAHLKLMKRVGDIDKYSAINFVARKIRQDNYSRWVVEFDAEIVRGDSLVTFPDFDPKAPAGDVLKEPIGFHIDVSFLLPGFELRGGSLVVNLNGVAKQFQIPTQALPQGIFFSRLKPDGEITPFSPYHYQQDGELKPGFRELRDRLKTDATPTPK